MPHDAKLFRCPTDLSRPPVRRALANVPIYPTGISLADVRRIYAPATITKMVSNENLFGPSPKVGEAVANALGAFEAYPDPFSRALRGAIAERLGVAVDRIIAGAGSESLIDFMMRAMLDAGDEVVISSPTFPFYEIFARVLDCRLTDIPRMANFDLDVEAVAAAVASGPKLLVLCTPNNPTGNTLTCAELDHLLSRTPHATSVLLDEAYFEFSDRADSLAALDAWGGHYLVARTFSKAYALANLRVGYAIGSSKELVAAMNLIRPTFNLTGLSQAAALAAWTDVEHMERTVGMIVAERGRVEAAIDRLGVPRAASGANFIFMRSLAPPAQANEHFLSEGVVVRPQPGLDWIRVSIGRPQENDRFLDVAPSALLP